MRRIWYKDGRWRVKLRRKDWRTYNGTWFRVENFTSFTKALKAFIKADI